MQNLENLQFEELKSKLEMRFGETHSLQNYYSQFTNRKQKFEKNRFFEFLCAVVFSNVNDVKLKKVRI